MLFPFDLKSFPSISARSFVCSSRVFMHNSVPDIDTFWLKLGQTVKFSCHRPSLRVVCPVACSCLITVHFKISIFVLIFLASDFPQLWKAVIDILLSYFMIRNQSGGGHLLYVEQR